jgi:predicted nucleic acid-binding protein
VRFLVEANILSEATKPAPNPAVVEWLRAHERDLAVSLVVSANCGMKWAELLARLRSSGKAMPIKDSLIAATALVHHLTVVTRNRADFSNAGVPIVDPFGG